MLLLLKEIRKKDFDAKRFQEILKIGREVFLSKDGLDLLKRIIMYTFYTTSMKKQKVKEILKETLTEERTEEMMTTAEKLILEGKLEGELKGKLEGKLEGELKGKLETAVNMFKLDISEDLILKATGFSKADLFKKDKNGFHLDKLKTKRENRKLAIQTALEMWKNEFEIETIERVTELDSKWLKRFFKKISMSTSEE